MNQTNNQIPITMDVKIHTLHPNGSVLANASVTLGGCFAVRGLKIVNGSNGPFVSMPSYKAKGEYRDICFPCTKEFRQQFHQAVMGAYQQELDQLQHYRMEQTPGTDFMEDMGEEAPEPGNEEVPEEGPSMGGMTMN